MSNVLVVARDGLFGEGTFKLSEALKDEVRSPARRLGQTLPDRGSGVCKLNKAEDGEPPARSLRCVLRWSPAGWPRTAWRRKRGGRTPPRAPHLSFLLIIVRSAPTCWAPSPCRPCPSLLARGKPDTALKQEEVLEASEMNNPQ